MQILNFKGGVRRLADGGFKIAELLNFRKKIAFKNPPLIPPLVFIWRFSKLNFATNGGRGRCIEARPPLNRIIILECYIYCSKELVDEGGRRIQDC